MPMTCPVCNKETAPGPAAQFRQRLRGLSKWYCCTHCRSYFTTSSEMKEETELLRQNAWSAPEAGLQINQYKLRLYRKILGLMASEKKGRLEILDHGASYGGFCFEAKKAGHHPIGMDIFPEAVDYLNTNGIPSETASSVSGLKKYRDFRFDAVTAIDSCYYWRNLSGELGQICDHLKENGLLVLRTSEKSRLFRAGVILKKIFPSAEILLKKCVHDHLSCTPLCTLLSILKSSGLKVLKVSSISAIPSYRTPVTTKIFYWTGEVLYRIFRISFSPGFVVICIKDKKATEKQSKA